ncbi:MAG: endonuclease III, partial [Candidatus Aenigmarchaeota archaeon]|nr:endonuclease III [Candidatus Aenigmarchaeota archaeon]
MQKEDLKNKAGLIISILKKEYGSPETALKHNTAHQILIATILSAQCTDKQVNIVTEDLFKKYPDISSLAKANPEDIKTIIKSTGFYRNKAKNIINTSKMILDDFKGKVPDTMKNLIKLPGVARKTANIVLSEYYGKNEGIAVDTHVIRLSGRL